MFIEKWRKKNELEKYLRKATDKDIENWEDALKQFIKEGKKLGMPLEVITK